MASLDTLVWLGTYSDKLYACPFSVRTGEVGPAVAIAEVVRPSFVAFHPHGRFIYAVSEQDTGTAIAWDIGTDHRSPRLLNRASSRGAGPCHIAVDRTGRVAIVANYGNGSLTVLRIAEDGGLGEVTWHRQFSGSSVRLPRQSRAHPHGAFFSPDNRFVVVPDLGCDHLRIYLLDAESGSLAAAEPALVRLPPGSGPRHFVFHPTGQWAYALCELESAVAVFHFDRASGRLRHLGRVSILPPSFHGENIAAGIALDEGGRYLYCSNRGADSIAVLRVGPDGTLDALQHAPSQGRTPRHFAIDPSGQWLLVANQDSGQVAVFRRDPLGGSLEPAGRAAIVPAPSCIVFGPVTPASSGAKSDSPAVNCPER